MLASCGTPSGPRRPVEIPPAAPLAVDPRVCAPVRSIPAQPDDATFPAPVTAAERAAVALFTDWVAAVLDVGGENEGRAAVAKVAVCPKG